MSDQLKKGLQSRRKREKQGLSGKHMLLLIGIDDYDKGIGALNNAVRDAEAVQEVLLEQYQFEASNCISLFNEKATRKAILQVFDRMIDLLTEQDTLTFYFSGHGEWLPSRKQGYWLPVDAVAGDRSTYLPNTEVLDLIKLVRARHVFGIVDSCFSGGLFQQKKLEVPGRQFSIPSRWLLTAGRLEPVSDGSLGAHSPFAESLLAQLKFTEEKVLWVGDLCRKVLHGMQFNTEVQIPRGEPLQGVGHQGGEFALLRQGAILKEEDSKNSSSDTLDRGLTDEKTSGKTASFSQELDALERDGLQEQAELLAKKLFKLKKALILETDPARQFTYETQIEECEAALQAIKDKMN